MFGSTEGHRPQQKLSVKDTSEVVCDTCKGNVFSEGNFLRKVSSLLTGQPKDSYLPISTFYCVKCHTVNDCFIPEELEMSLLVMMMLKKTSKKMKKLLKTLQL